MISAIELAKYIVSKCSSDGCPISNLQLQKILFFIQKDRLRKGGWFIADDFEAWQYGPVIKNVYNMFSIYAGIKIDEVYSYKLPERVKHDVNAIIEYLRELNPWELVAKTHKENGAWDKIYNDGMGYREIIPKDLIASKG